MSESNYNQMFEPRESKPKEKEYKVYESIDSLPFNVDDLPEESRQYFTPAKDHTQQYVVLEQDGKPSGFSILDIPNEPSDSCECSYNYVFPEMRQQGVGKKLIISSYEHAKDKGFMWVEGGINSVLKMSAGDSVWSYLEKGLDGTWANYKTMNSVSYSDGTYPKHEVHFVSVNSHDNTINFAFRTNVQETSKESTLPSEPVELFKLLQEQVLPPNSTPTTLMHDAEFNHNIFAYKDKKALSFSEFKTEVKLISR